MYSRDTGRENSREGGGGGADHDRRRVASDLVQPHLRREPPPPRPKVHGKTQSTRLEHVLIPPPPLLPFSLRVPLPYSYRKFYTIGNAKTKPHNIHGND